MKKSVMGQIDTKRSIGHVEFDNENLSKLRQTKFKTEFLPSPNDLTNESFDDESELCVKELNIDLKIVIESYKKCISSSLLFINY